MAFPGHYVVNVQSQVFVVVYLMYGFSIDGKVDVEVSDGRGCMCTITRDFSFSCVQHEQVVFEPFVDDYKIRLHFRLKFFQRIRLV